MTTKQNLSDVTFLIPVRLDSIDRVVNLRATLSFLLQNFNTRIDILEADKFNTGLISNYVTNQDTNINYRFIEDFDTVFFRTAYINKMVRKCKTPYLSVWDTDIIGVPDLIVGAVNALREGKANFSFSYEKNFLDTSLIIRELFLKTNDWRILDKHQKKMAKLYPPKPVGGAFFANKQAYVDSGLENPNFYGWGIEDGERVNRWLNLGYNIHREQGNLYHLTHARGTNSTFHSTQQRNVKKDELMRIASMDREELLKEISEWHQ